MAASYESGTLQTDAVRQGSAAAEMFRARVYCIKCCSPSARNTIRVFCYYNKYLRTKVSVRLSTSCSGFQAGVSTPRGKFSDLSARLLPEIFDRVAFERELRGNFASRGPSLRRGAHQKPQTRSRGSGGVRARVESEGTLRAPRARSALLPRNRAHHAVRRRAVEWENSVLKVKIDQNENFQITRHS